MTRLLTILTIIVLTGCKTYQSVPAQFEDQLVITKKYIGQVSYTEIKGKTTIVVCGYDWVELCGQVHVPAFVQGYVRTEPCYMDVHPEIRRRLERKYFSWNNVEYKVKTW